MPLNYDCYITISAEKVVMLRGNIFNNGCNKLVFDIDCVNPIGDTFEGGKWPHSLSFAGNMQKSQGLSHVSGFVTASKRLDSTVHSYDNNVWCSVEC